MTREEAKQNTWRAHCNFDDPRKAIHIVIDQIFDYFGEQLQDKDDEIELLKHHVEEAMKPKTCDGCKYQKIDIDRCDFCKRYYSDQYSPKE